MVTANKGKLGPYPPVMLFMQEAVRVELPPPQVAEHSVQVETAQ